MTFEHGLFDGQLRSKFRAIVACPHWVPFIAGGSGRCFPSNLCRKLIKYSILFYFILNFNSRLKLRSAQRT